MKNFVVAMWSVGTGGRMQFHFISEEHPVKAIIKSLEESKDWDEMLETYPTTNDGLEELLSYYSDGDVIVDVAELPH